MKCNFWDEWLSLGPLPRRGLLLPTPAALCLWYLQLPDKEKSPTSFQPWQCCRACAGAGKQVVFDGACTLSAMLLADDF